MNSEKKNQVINKAISNKSFDSLVEEIFSNADKDGSGFVEKGEYIILCQRVAKELNTTPPSEEEILKGLLIMMVNYPKEEFRTLVKYLLKVVVENME